MYCNAFSKEIPSITQPLVAWLHDQDDAFLERWALERSDIDARVFYPRVMLGEYLQSEFDRVARFHAEAAAWAQTVPSVMVNNAGIQTWSSLLDLKTEDWNRTIATNLRGTFLNTQMAAKAMIAAGQPGSIITLGSGCNKIAFPKLVDYTTSKGGIEQFTKVAAVELGPHNIRVNCIAPGAIATARTAAEAPDYDATWARVTPLRRVGTPQDLTGPLLFLISDAAAFVTGQTLWVDGGVFSQANWPYET